VTIPTTKGAERDSGSLQARHAAPERRQVIERGDPRRGSIRRIWPPTRQVQPALAKRSPQDDDRAHAP